MRKHANGFGSKLRQVGSAISDAFRGAAGRLTRSSSGRRGRSYAGGRTRGARQPQGPTPVLGAPGTPIRSSAAWNSSTAHNNTAPGDGSSKRGTFRPRVGLKNKKRFAVTMTAITAAVLVPIFATSALEGGTFGSHGVSVNRPAVLETEETEDTNITLGAYASGTIVEHAPQRAAAARVESEAPAKVEEPEEEQGNGVEEKTTPNEPEESSNEGAAEEPGEEENNDQAEESPEPEPSDDGYRALEPGVTNDAVIELQQRLMELHYMENDEPTNYYGPQTQQAVAYFQRKNGLTVDGYAGPETQDKLFSGEAKVYTVADGAEGGDVWEIQERLAELGYPVSVTGYYGSQTSDAVKYFQRMNGITDDGSVGTDTKDVLFSESAEPAIPPEPEPEVQSEEGGQAAEEAGDASENNGGGGGDSSKEDSSNGGGGGETSSKHQEEEQKEEEEEKHSGGGGGDAPAASSGSVEAFVDAACAQEGKPYVLGGKGPSTFDCSGLVYYALKASGNGIGYMTSGGWAQSGYPSISWDNLRRGDVICFTGHVAVYLGDGMMCDASSSNGQIMIRSMGNWARNNFICGKRPL